MIITEREFQRTFDVLCLVAFTAMLAVWSAVLLRNYPIVMEFADTLPLSRSLLGQFQAVDGSLLAIVYQNLETIAPVGMATLAKLGLSLEAVQTLLVHLSMWTGFAGMYAAAWKLSGSHWAGLIAALILPATWLNALSVGYGLFFWIHHPALGAMGGAWVIAVWSTYLCLNDHRRLWPLPYSLCGALFYIHPTNAMILGLCFGCATLLRSVQDWRAGRFALQTWFGIALLAIVVLPGAVPILLSAAPQEQFDAGSWWALMAFRKPHHVLMWSGYTILSVFALAAISTALVYLLSKGASQRLAIIVVGTLVPCFALAAVGYVAVEVVPSPRLAGLVLSRSLDLVVALSVVMASALAATMLSKATGASTYRSTGYHLTAAALPLAMVATQLGPLLTPNSLLALGSGGCAGMGAFFISTRAPPLHLVRYAASISITVAVIICVTPKILTDARNLAANNSPKEWAKVTAWVRDHTAENSLLILPPYPAGTYASQRSNVIDHLYMGYSVYVFDALHFELDALRSIYGIDLSRKSTTEVQRMSRAAPMSLPECLLEDGYKSMLDDPARVRLLIERYQPAYLVGLQPNVKPEAWSCGTFMGSRLPWPVVYENGEYIIYNISRPAPP